MLTKVYLLFIALQLVCVLACDYIHFEETDGTPNLKKIRNEMYRRMTLFTQGLWNVTPPDENIQFYPIIDAVNTNLAMTYLYHQYGLASLVSKSLFLELPLEFANLLPKIQTTRWDIPLFLRIVNGVFFTKNHTNEDYLRDVKTYFCSLDARERSGGWDPQFVIPLLPAMRSWLEEDIERRKVEIEKLVTPGFTDYHTSALHLTAYWDIPMDKSNDILFDLGRRLDDGHRNSAPMFKTPTTNFENQTKLYVDAFTSKGKIGYFNDTRSGYEVIRLPHLTNRIATAIVLPHRNQTLKMFVNFTAQDYEQLFERVNENFQLIEFIIPSLRIAMVSMNESKTTINGITAIERLFPENRTKSSSTCGYRKFVVDRPYGVFIYHVKTKFVLWHGLIRDPTSTEYVFRRFINHTSPIARELDLKYIT